MSITMRFSVFLLLIIFRLTAMTPEELNDELPPNYKANMPVEFINSAKLSAEGKFQESADVLCKFCEIHQKENDCGGPYIMTSDGYQPIFDRERIIDDLQSYQNVVDNLGNTYNLDPNYSIEDYAYEAFMGHIWWHYYAALL